MPKKSRTNGRRPSDRPSGRRPAGSGRPGHAPRRHATRRTHEAVCAECDSPTTVPFKPAPGRPVYCRPCFTSLRDGAGSPVKTGPAKRARNGHQNGHRDAAADKRQAPARQRANAPAPANGHDAAARPFRPSGSDGVFAGIEMTRATRAAIARMDISEPTPIQEQSIPVLLSGRDLVGQAQTGSGKTLAFAVPIAEVCDPQARRVQALILTPTRELALQVAGVIFGLASSRGVSVTSVVGGRSIGREKAALRRGADVVVGTPGRTLDHLRQGTLDLGAVRFLVLDEADEMLDQGFARDVEAILGHTPDSRQTALFSATMPNWVANTAKKYLRNPAKVEVDNGVQESTVEHLVYSIQRDDKIAALRTLLDDRGGAPILVFGRTKHGVRKLAKKLDSMGYPVGALQGNLSQGARERVMRSFRSGAAPILVATNVAARGIDVQGIGQVINYDLPDSQRLFTHRVGRTGRMGSSGEAVTFITPDEERKWREIQRGLGRRFSRRPWRAPAS